MSVVLWFRLIAVIRMRSSDLEIECQVIKTLSDYLSVGHGAIKTSSRLVEDLYFDSMSIIEVVMMLNETFGAELPAVAVSEWNTVADIRNSVIRVRDV